MRDLWAVLLQTLTASGAAVLLLVVKAIFRDKLSPRWQFGIWGVLGLILLLPAGLLGRYVLVNWPLAADYQDQGERLDLRLLKWRTVHTVLLTVTTAMGYAARRLPEWWTYLVLCVTVVCLLACICIMVTLFRLRKCI